LHPGEILREEYLVPLGMTAEDLAQALAADCNEVEQLISESGAISGELALRLARYFSTTPQLWMNMQARYELEVARAADGQRIEREVTPRAS
jgi:addiction module HigA family antidote